MMTQLEHLVVVGDGIGGNLKPFNESPQQTAVGDGRSAVAVHVASRRGLSFFR